MFYSKTFIFDPKKYSTQNFCDYQNFLVVYLFPFWYFRPSSIGGCLHFKYFNSLVWSHELRPIFGEDLTSGCWDIYNFDIWGPLQLEVVFNLNIFIVWFDHIFFSFKLGVDLVSCWNISFLNIWDCHPLGVLLLPIL